MRSLLFCVVALSSLTISRSEQQQEIFGTQCSFPITGHRLDGCPPEMLDHRQEFYEHFFDGCVNHFSKRECLDEEMDRWDQNQYQPMGLINMTSTGFMKIKAPDSLRKLLTNFWEKNKDQQEKEDWERGEATTNHWEAPTYMISIEDDNLSGGGERLKKAIWNAAIDGIAKWTGGVAKLRPVSLYGIRVYTEGAVLSSHVDRLPLVSSGIFNVAQDVDEPWPLEVYDRNGHAVNVTMEPGDMVLYESHSLIHGRPFPMKGRYFANVFIHFEPFDGWDTARGETQLGDNNGDLPPYILPGTRMEQEFRKEFPNGWSKFYAEGEEPPVNEWAKHGKIDKLKKAAALDVRLLWHQDENGWEPIHEAARYGQTDVVKFLVESGAGINDLTSDGMSPYRIAIEHHGSKHPLSKYLEHIGAEEHGGDTNIDDTDYETNTDDQDNDDDSLDEDDEYQAYSDQQSDEMIEEQLAEIVPALQPKSGLREVLPSIRDVEQAVERTVREVTPVVIAGEEEDL